MNEDLDKWFKEKWVNIGKKVDGKHPPCGTSGEKRGYAKCVPAAKAAGMSKKEKESATQRKRAAQNDAGRGGKDSSGQGKKPINVSTKPKNEEWSDKYKSSIDCNNPKGFSQKAHCQGKKKNENMNIEERLNLFLEKNCPTDPGKWSASKAAAKSKFDVYPSAYANGWAAKNYKGKGGGWKTCSENVVNEDNTAFETLMLIRNLEQTNKLLAQDLKTSKRLPNDKKENIKKSIVVNQGLINYYKETYKNLKNNESVNEAPIPIKDGKYHFYYKDGVGYLEFNGKKISSGDYDMEDGSNSYWMSHSSFKGSQKAFKTGKDIVNYFKSKKITTESVNEACWDGYKQVGGKMKNGKMVPNCVPIKENHIDTDYDELDVEPEEIEDFIEFLKAYKNTLAEANCGCVYEAEYQGREVKLGKPMQGDVKKFKVYVKNPAGKVVKVNFGQKGMKIRKSNPAARKSFRARMNCDNPGPRTKANYWSCRKW